MFYSYIEETFPYTVIYRGYDPATHTEVILDTVIGSAPAGETVAIEYKDFFGYRKDENEEMFLQVSADGKATKTLNYTLIGEPYVIFRTQGSYIAPITATAGSDIRGQIQTNLQQAPTRQGYEFAGWEYDGTTYTDVDSLAAAISTMPAALTYVDAVWNPASDTPYTVLIWLENADDDEYSLYTNVIPRYGTTGMEVTATQEDIAKGENNSNISGNDFFGFDYSRCENTVIAADGTAVLNLYYDREIWKINYMEADGKTVWRTIEGKYMSLIGDKLLDRETLKAHYGEDFGYMVKTYKRDDAAMLERFENSQVETVGHGMQNIYPYDSPRTYEYIIRHFSYDPNNYDPNDPFNMPLLIRTSYIPYEKEYAPGMYLIPPKGFVWEGGTWKTSYTEAKLATARPQKNPKPMANSEDGMATFLEVYPFMEINMERVKSNLSYVSNEQTIKTETDVPYEKNVDLTIVPDNPTAEYMEFQGWYTEPEEPVKPGYTFLGWYTEKTGGEFWTFERTIQKDTTLYAHWRISNTAPFTMEHIIVGEDTPFYTVTGESVYGDGVYAEVLSAEDAKYPEDVYLEPQDASRTIVIDPDGSKNVVTFTYKIIGLKDYTVSYLEEGTESVLAPQKLVRNTLHTVVTELPENIAGYDCRNADGYVTSTLTEAGPNAIVFYDYVPDTTPTDGNITVSKTVSGNAGEPTAPFHFTVTLDNTTTATNDTGIIPVDSTATVSFVNNKSTGGGSTPTPDSEPAEPTPTPKPDVVSQTSDLSHSGYWLMRSVLSGMALITVNLIPWYRKKKR